MKGIYVVLLLCCGVSTVLGHPDGASTTSCTSLMPGHTGVSPQNGDSPYSLEIVGGATSFSKGDSINVKITGQQYGGFLIQLRKKGETTPLGTWAPGPNKLLTCTTADSAITHHSAYAKATTTEYTWNAPDSANGDYEFVATVAETKETYWTGLKSSTLTANYPADNGNGNTDSKEKDKENRDKDKSGKDRSGSSSIFFGVTLVVLTLATLTLMVFV